METTRDTNNTAPVEKPRLRTLALASGYVVVWLALWYASSGLNLMNGVSLWSPPAGLTFAILLEYGGRALPLPILASLIAGMSGGSCEQWPYYLAANLAMPLGYLIAALALRRYPGGRRREQWRFNSPKH